MSFDTITDLIAQNSLFCDKYRTKRSEAIRVMIITTILTILFFIGLFFIIIKFSKYKTKQAMDDPSDQISWKLYIHGGLRTETSRSLAQLYMLYNEVGIVIDDNNEVIITWKDDSNIFHQDQLKRYLSSYEGKIPPPCSSRFSSIIDEKRLNLCNVLRQLQILSSFNFMDNGNVKPARIAPLASFPEAIYLDAR